MFGESACDLASCFISELNGIEIVKSAVFVKHDHLLLALIFVSSCMTAPEHTFLNINGMQTMRNPRDIIDCHLWECGKAEQGQILSQKSNEKQAGFPYVKPMIDVVLPLFF